MVDLLVVILGITIAFGIDNWAETRRNEQTKQQYLISLSNDLRVDSVALVENQQDLQELDSVLAVVQSLTYQDNQSNADSIARAMNIFGRYGFLPPKIILTNLYSRAVILAC